MQQYLRQTEDWKQYPGYKYVVSCWVTALHFSCLGSCTTIIQFCCYLIISFVIQCVESWQLFVLCPQRSLLASLPSFVWQSCFQEWFESVMTLKQFYKLNELGESGNSIPYSFSFKSWRQCSRKLPDQKMTI